MSAPENFVPVAATIRSGYVESVHHGAAVVVDADGGVVWSIGDPDDGFYGRSANKPLQAQAMLDLGAKLDGPGLALACSSHSGGPEHLQTVREILASVDLTEAALDNTPDLPFDSNYAFDWVASGHPKTSITQNCSGKHAAMLATCVANGWDTSTYLDVDHPVQEAITSAVDKMTGGVVHLGIDGCGAPTHATTLTGLARAFSGLATARGEVWSAMTTYPELVGGPGRLNTRLMQTVPAMIAKDGADGILAGAMPEGYAIALKVADGASRATGPLFVRAAQIVGFLTDLDPADFGVPILGHGTPVGQVEPLI